MNRWSLVLCAALSGCSRDALTSDGDRGDASAVVDLGGSDGAARDGTPADGAARDLNPCPSYYINSGACPGKGLVCHYFESACYCDDNEGLWFCCSTVGRLCPPSSEVPPANGEMCSGAPFGSCEFDCHNGMATRCSCVGCRWKCTTSACTRDGG